MDQIGDDTVGLAAVLLLFLIPNGTTKDQALLTWEDAKTIPWGLLLLFGGGIAIAKAFSSSGLSLAIGEQLSVASSFPTIVMIGGICVLVTFLTEITSNTATTTLLMPILAAMAISTGIDPKIVMIPAALSASCAFMLPVATAPNAIVFGTEKLTVMDMAKTGLGLNIIAAIVITICCQLMLIS
jgi:solute carrier family 13 (sodium-dependent dicarboxylate transporter), member 2/3/5